ncbi:MAG: MFS transporter [Alphaproteobacteria bacterium]|nr:MFS transporter [Alphaproteobacteria bacterium]
MVARRATLAGIGVYFGVLQLVFTLTWTVYVVYLPRLAAAAGISGIYVAWILVLDQLIFALCDWAVGIAADRVAQVIGRLGLWIAAITVISALAFLLLPFAASGIGPVPFLVIVAIWSATSSALRAPPLVLLGRYAPTPSQPWLASLLLLGVGIASMLSPLVMVELRNVDPRIPFVLSAAAVALVTGAITWAERMFARDAEIPPSTRASASMPGVGPFLAAIALLAIGYQVHAFLNSGAFFLRFVGPDRLALLTPAFWLGFNLLMPPASLLTRRYGGLAIMALGALIGAAAAWAAAQAGDVISLVTAQFIAGGAWGCVSMSAVAAALAIGRTGAEGRVSGLMFSLVAAAALARIVVVAIQLPQQVPAIAEYLPWLPALAWLLAGLLLLAAARPMQRR